MWEYVRRQDTERQDERSNEAVTPTQGEPCKFREHSRESPDLMASIQNLHIQQRQNPCSVQELNQTMSPAPQTPRVQVSQQEDDLITFTPIRGAASTSSAWHSGEPRTTQKTEES